MHAHSTAGWGPTQHHVGLKIQMTALNKHTRMPKTHEKGHLRVMGDHGAYRWSRLFVTTVQWVQVLPCCLLGSIELNLVFDCSNYPQFKLMAHSLFSFC